MGEKPIEEMSDDELLDHEAKQQKKRAEMTPEQADEIREKASAHAKMAIRREYNLPADASEEDLDVAMALAAKKQAEEIEKLKEEI